MSTTINKLSNKKNNLLDIVKVNLEYVNISFN